MLKARCQAVCECSAIRLPSVIQMRLSDSSFDLARSVTIQIDDHATDQSRAGIIIGDRCARGIKSQDVADFRFGLILSIKV